MSVEFEQSIFQTLTTIATPLYVYFLLDKSGSMEGDPIAQLNEAGKEITPGLADLQDHNPGVKIMLKVLSFSNAPTWETPNWVEAKQFKWTDLQAGGGTNAGLAFEELSRDMNPENLGTRGNQPHILFLTDGRATDDWQAPLKQLITNAPWGEASIRSAIAFGNADIAMLNEWIGNSGGVLAKPENAADLALTLQVLALSMVEFGSSAGSDIDGKPQGLKATYDRTMENARKQEDR